MRFHAFSCVFMCFHVFSCVFQTFSCVFMRFHDFLRADAIGQDLARSDNKSLPRVADYAVLGWPNKLAESPNKLAG